MKERIYEGTIEGLRFRYSVPAFDRPYDDPSFERYVRDKADRQMGHRLLLDLIERGVVRVREEDWDF